MSPVVTWKALAVGSWQRRVWETVASYQPGENDVGNVNQLQKEKQKVPDY
jgi:hypothetical protein